jgi:hypothetical protein
VISKHFSSPFSMTRRPTQIVAVSAAATMVVALHGVAMAAFEPPVTVANGSTANPQIDGDVTGQAWVVWERHDGADNRVFGRTITSGGSLSPIKSLSANGREANGPQIGVGGGGLPSMAVWSGSDGTINRIRARTMAADGALGPIKTLSAAGQDASKPQIDSENAPVLPIAVVWERSDGTNSRIQVRRIQADGDLGPTKTLSAAGVDATDPQVNVDTNGLVVVVWRTDGASRLVQARVVDPGGVLGKTKTLSANGQVASAPQVEAEAGQATVVWELGNQVQARQIATNGTLGPTMRLSPVGKNAASPQIDVDADGRSRVVWHALLDDGHVHVQTRTIDLGGTLSSIKTITPDGKDGFNPTVGIHLFGHATIAWQFGTFGDAAEIQARTIDQDGTVGPIETLTGERATAIAPDVTGDSSDPPTVVWNLPSGGVQYAR